MKQDRQAKKRADLEMLSTLLQIADQFGPERQQREELGAAAVQEAQLRNQGLEVGLPFLGREAEARVGTQEDQRGYARDQHPLAMQVLQGQATGQGLENQFLDRSMQPRLGLLGAQGQRAQQEVDQSADLHPINMRAGRIANTYNQRRSDLVIPEFKQGQDYTNVQMAGQMQNMGATLGQKLDTAPWLQGRGVQPLPGAGAGGGPEMDEATLFALLIKRGFNEDEIAQIIQRTRQSNGR